MKTFGQTAGKFFHAMTSNPTTGTPVKKKARSPAAGDDDGMSSDADERSVPLTANQRSWIGGAVSAAFTAFGEHIEDRVLEVEAKIKTREEEAIWLKGQVEELQSKLVALTPVDFDDGQTNAALTARFAQVDQQIQELKSVQAAPLPPPGLGGRAGSSISSDASPPGDWLSEVPPELRRYARLGNLGFDTDAPTLLTRAKAFLTSIGVAPEDYKCLQAVRDPGSICSLTFSDSVKLQDAKRASRVLSFTQPGCAKPTWLDVEKSKAELKPARIIHRAAELITDFETGRPDRQDVTKILNGKQIKIEGRLVCYTYRGTLQWASLGLSRYSADERMQVAAFAEST